MCLPLAGYVAGYYGDFYIEVIALGVLYSGQGGIPDLPGLSSPNATVDIRYWPLSIFGTGWTRYRKLWPSTR